MKEPLQFKQKPSLFVTPSKAEWFAVVPPPNHSFKRTGELVPV
jgi:hypothetical protein